MLKKNSIKFGLLIGFVAPLVSLVAYYFIKFYPLFSVRDFANFIASSKSQITAITVPCLVLNIALFTIYINGHRDNTAKGIFAITLLYALVALIMKFTL